MDKTLSQLETQLKRIERARAEAAQRERLRARRLATARERAEVALGVAQTPGLSLLASPFIFDHLTHALSLDSLTNPAVIVHLRRVMGMLSECGALAAARPDSRLWPLAVALRGGDDGGGNERAATQEISERAV